MLEPTYLFKELPSLYLIGSKLPWAMDHPRSDRGTPPSYVTDYGRRVRLKASNNKIKDAVLVKANNTIPKDCPFFYFEVHIEDFGSGNTINVGLTTAGYKEGRYIGEDKGYSVLLSSEIRRHRTQSNVIVHHVCKTKDVIGIGINNINKSIFITKNGEKEDIGFNGIVVDDYYPAVFLESPSSSLHINFGQNYFHYDISQEIEPLINKVREVSNIPLPDPDTYGCTFILESIYDYMNVNAHTQTLNEISNYLVPDYCKGKEQIEYSHGIFKKIQSKDFLSVYNEIMASNSDLQEKHPSCYLGILSFKFYHDALALTTSDIDQVENEIDNELLNSLIIQAESIEDIYSQIFKPEYLDVNNKLDECGLTYSDWKIFIENLLGLMCFDDQKKFEEFNKLYDLRQKIWAGIFHVLNSGKSSVLNTIAIDTLKNFEVGILNKKHMAYFGFAHALNVYDNKEGLEFF